MKKSFGKCLLALLMAFGRIIFFVAIRSYDIDCWARDAPIDVVSALSIELLFSLSTSNFRLSTVWFGIILDERRMWL